MTDAIAALLLYCLWTFGLLALLLLVRTALVLSGRRGADGFSPAEYESTSFPDRLHRAYLNSLELLPLFAIVVAGCEWTGLGTQAGSVAIWVTVARVLQSCTHMLGAGKWLVQLRFTFFLVQVVLLGKLLMTLLGHYLPYF